jgi:hypothetical protein
MEVIDSLYHNFYIPPVIFAVMRDEDDEEVRVCVDGKQRLTSIVKFLDGQVRPSPFPPLLPCMNSLPFSALDWVCVVVYRFSHLPCVTRGIRQTGILIRGNFGGIKSQLPIEADEMRSHRRERGSLRISA